MGQFQDSSVAGSRTACKCHEKIHVARKLKRNETMIKLSHIKEDEKCQIVNIFNSSLKQTVIYCRYFFWLKKHFFSFS